MSSENSLPWTSSKKDIYQAYKEILAKYNTLSTASPKREVKNEREIQGQADLLQKVSVYTPENLMEAIARMKVSIGKTLDGISEDLSKESSKLLELQRASQVSQQELERYDDSKISAQCLELWLYDHEEEKAKAISELEAQKGKLREEIAKQREVWKEERDRSQKEQKEFLEDLKKVRLREEQEYAYSQKVLKKQDGDIRKAELEEFDYKMKMQKRDLEEELAKEREMLEKHKEECSRLRQEGAQWPHRLEERVKEVRAEVTKELVFKHDHSMALSSHKAKSDQEVSQTKIESLEGAVMKLESQVERLQGKLEEETKRVHDIANKAVEGASGATAFGAVNQIAIEQAKNKGAGSGEG